MARGRNSLGGGSLACQRAIERQDDYKKNVTVLHANTKIIAESLSRDGRIDTILKNSDDGNADAFLVSARTRLKAIAEGNAKRMYEIEYFVEAMKEVQKEVQNETGDGEASADAPDYERSIHDAMDRVHQQGENDPSRSAPEDHEMSTEIRQALGEKIQKKRSRASRGGGDDEDDDLEIVNNQTDDHRSLQCPITGMLFVNPVKNKVCHHVYDRAGLAQMLRAKKSTCPVPGCTNRGVTNDQVEEDEEMKLKVKRHKTREDAEKRKRKLEDDDDMGEGGGGGYTVLE